MKNHLVAKIGGIALLAMLAVLPGWSGGAGEQAPQVYTIEVSGSTSVYPLMEDLADEYAKSVPTTQVNANGTGSSDGITAANTGTSEVGMSSRGLKSSELGYGLDELTIAIDAIAVVVHNSNGVSDLSLEQVRQIYVGEITNWSQLGGADAPIAVVSREPGSGTRGAFEEVVGFEGQLVAGAIEFDGTGGVRASVAGNPNGIGYISLGSLDSSVKAVSIDGAQATSANVVAGSYGIARPFLLLYRAADISPQTRAFFDWIMSAAGQEIVGGSYVKVQ